MASARILRAYRRAPIGRLIFAFDGLQAQPAPGPGLEEALGCVALRVQPAAERVWTDNIFPEACFHYLMRVNRQGCGIEMRIGYRGRGCQDYDGPQVAQRFSCSRSGGVRGDNSCISRRSWGS